MRGVVGNDGDLRLRVSLFKCASLVLGKAYCAENEVDERLYGINIVGGYYSHIRNFCRTFALHLPSARNGIGVLLSRRAGTCNESGDLKIRMLRKKHYKSLTYHTGSADYTNLKLFH